MSKKKAVSKCSVCSATIFRLPGKKGGLGYSCDCRKWRSRAKPLPRSSRSMSAIRDKFRAFILLSVDEGLSLQQVLIGARKQYCAKHGDGTKKDTRALRINDVANILRPLGYTFDGMDRPFVQWTPKGTEIVRKEV